MGNGAVTLAIVTWVILQVAAAGHPSLVGAVAVCATDARYEDDMHYQGGCLLSENLSWGSWLMHVLSQPPDPTALGSAAQPGAWREQWLARLSALEPLAAKWMRHPSRDDPYWAVGSARPHARDIRVPLLLLGGTHAGGYINSVAALAAEGATSAPVTALVGPWSHNYPHISPNGPQVRRPHLPTVVFWGVYGRRSLLRNVVLCNIVTLLKQLVLLLLTQC